MILNARMIAVIFQGVLTRIAKKPYIFVIFFFFGGGGEGGGAKHDSILEL